MVPDTDGEKVAFLTSFDTLALVENEMLPNIKQLISSDIRRIAWGVKKTQQVSTAEQLLANGKEAEIKNLVEEVFVSTEGERIPDRGNLPLNLGEDIRRQLPCPVSRQL